MEIFQLIYLAILLASSIVYAQVNDESKISLSDVRFKTYELKARLSVEQIQDREASKENLEKKLKVLWESIGRLSESLSEALSKASNVVIHNEIQSNSTKSTIVNILQEISNYRQINGEFRLPVLIKSLKRIIVDAGLSENNAADAENILVEIIDTFASGESPFFKFPSLAIPTLESLASFVETFVRILSNQNNTLASETKIACDVANTVHDYFQPALLERFMRINIIADYHRFLKNNKYVFSQRISNQPFYLNRYEDFIRCVPTKGGKDQYLKEKLAFEKTKAFRSEILKFMGPNLLIEGANTDKFSFSLLRDNLGLDDTFYHDNDVEYGTCALDYFSFVRRRMELEFGDAFNKVKRVCSKKIGTKKPTGFGWLTIKVGSLLAERLNNGSTCGVNDTPVENESRTIVNHFCEPYVKMTVNYELGGKQMTQEHRTDFKVRAVGWTQFDETLYFDKIPGNASVAIKILNSDNQIIFSETMQVSELTDRILFENSNSKMFMISTWRDEVLVN